MTTFVVQAADLPVPIAAKFYAALDAADKFSWADDPFHAQRFDTMTDATQFAEEWAPGNGWVVVLAPSGAPITAGDLAYLV